jgi:hypothetical protein
MSAWFNPNFRRTFYQAAKTHQSPGAVLGLGCARSTSGIAAELTRFAGLASIAGL